MFIYGLKPVLLKTSKTPSCPCPNCHEKGGLTINIYRRHFHIFWIPMFPVVKIGRLTCSLCNHRMKMRKAPENTKLDYQNLKAKTKGPLWQFSGLAILVLLISAFITYGKLNSENYRKEKYEQYTNPKPGDVYEYVIKTGQYTTLKITKITSDSISFAPNKLESSSVFKLYKINKPENYTNAVFSVS
ncbi:hypothetical protein JJL45_02745 [Tamlana sp. s12]|uniref:hypothetical protein n=1 Tax=Tamlana sp. s12 TaxID=1630406 RepID=UPI00080008FE|nr:hypothetical protein [Tamlana sp. s12]OBQ52001.1 hypothetical protein VQ01_14815 [Tamlana sp. s12]QQY82928.1 hypothetical protein JJL45_02745 [Tamlana sp. s12]